MNASRNYEGSAWAAFDAAYRRRAASRRSLDWSVFDASLYGQAFMGRSRSIPRCRFCMEDSHLSRACALPLWRTVPRGGDPWRDRGCRLQVRRRRPAAFSTGACADSVCANTHMSVHGAGGGTQPPSAQRLRGAAGCAHAPHHRGHGGLRGQVRPEHGAETMPSEDSF